MRERAALSVKARHARTLLSAGALGGHLAALVVVPTMFALRGEAGGLAALIASLATVAFMGVGQLVQVTMADADPQRLLLASLASYAIRVSVPAGMLIVAGSDPTRLAGMDRLSLAVSTIVVVLGWLIAEIRAFSRLRIPVFDEPTPPST